MDKLVWMRGLMGAIAHLMIAAGTLIVGLLIGIGMAELAKVIEVALR